MRMGSEPLARVETAAGRKGKCSVGAERGPRGIPHSSQRWRLWEQRGKSLLQKSVAELRRELRCHGPDRAWGPICPNQQSPAQAGALCWGWVQWDGGSKVGTKLWVDCCFLLQAFWGEVIGRTLVRTQPAAPWLCDDLPALSLPRGQYPQGLEKDLQQSRCCFSPWSERASRGTEAATGHHEGSRALDLAALGPEASCLPCLDLSLPICERGAVPLADHCLRGPV